jgi:hypothetical protein
MDEKAFCELKVLGDWWGIPHAERDAHPLLIVSTRVEQEVIVIDALPYTLHGCNTLYPAGQSTLHSSSSAIV